MFITSVIPSNHLILCHPLLLLPSVIPSMRVISNESLFHIRWPKYWSFSFSVSTLNKYSGMISFRMNWLDLLDAQGTLKILFQSLQSKASILQRFSSVQSSHSVMSDSLRPHESQHARPPCPTPTPGVHPDSSPLSQ